MVKSLASVIYHGTKVIIKAIQKSLAEEIELSRQAANIRYSSNNSEKRKTPDQMSLNEAKLVLDVQNVYSEEITKKFNHLFEVNNKSQSGSFYLQSKVVRAKERLDWEIKNLQKTGKLNSSVNITISEEKTI